LDIPLHVSFLTWVPHINLVLLTDWQLLVSFSVSFILNCDQNSPNTCRNYDEDFKTKVLQRSVCVFKWYLKPVSDCQIVIQKTSNQSTNQSTQSSKH
jgi:hypothetical protein